MPEPSPVLQLLWQFDFMLHVHGSGASISSLIPALSCRLCSPNAPFAKLEMLTGGAGVPLNHSAGVTRKHGCSQLVLQREEHLLDREIASPEFASQLPPMRVAV
jgi:hypothetical protein